MTEPGEGTELVPELSRSVTAMLVRAAALGYSVQANARGDAQDGWDVACTVEPPAAEPRDERASAGGKDFDSSSLDGRTARRV